MITEKQFWEEMDRHPLSFYLNLIEAADELFDLKLARLKRLPRKKIKELKLKRKKTIVRNAKKGKPINRNPFFTTITKSNKTGVIGVFFLEKIYKSGKKSYAYVATWYPEKYKQKHQNFIAKGKNDKKAFENAVAFRKHKEKELSELRKEGLR